MYRTQRHSDGSPPGGGLLPGPVGPVSKILAILTGVGFLFMLFGVGFGPAGFQGMVEQWLAFTPAALRVGRIWTLLTYSFLGIAPIPAIFSVYFYWTFGSQLEIILGRWRFVRLWLAVSALPPLLAWGLMSLYSGLWNPDYLVAGYLTPHVGLIWALALIYPRAQMVFLFVIPIRYRVMAWIGTGLAAVDFIRLFRSGAGFAPLTAVVVAGVTFGLVRLWPKIALRYYGSKLNFLKSRRHKFDVLSGGRDSDFKDDHEVMH